MIKQGDKQDNVGPGANLADLMLLLKRRIEMELHVSMPATVVSYVPATRMAQVIPGYRSVAEIRGVETASPPTVLLDVPVAQLASNLNWVTVPIDPGTTGNIIFSDRCVQKWVKSVSSPPGAPNPLTVSIDPSIDRSHSIADGVFYPGLTTVPNAATTPHDNTATVVEGPVVRLGAAALTELSILGTSYIAAENLVSTAFLAWITAFQTLSAPMLAAPDPSGALLWILLNGMVGPTTTLFNALTPHVALTLGGALAPALSQKVFVE
jgi:hypothetical protein